MQMKYTKDKSHIIQVRLSEEQVHKIDAIAELEKRTRSEILRTFIIGGLSDGQTEKIAI